MFQDRAVQSLRVKFSPAVILRQCSGPVLGPGIVGTLTLAGCVTVAGLIHEPLPRLPDEFSYLLSSNLFAHGRVSSPTPPLPEFFETFAVIVRPVYAPKVFPAPGLFLAAGEYLTGHPCVGVWLSAVLACVATNWMLRAWVGPVGALVGSLIMVAQIGVFSYWSQSYWGGMVAALGGALFFGSLRRLSVQPCKRHGILLALGVILLATSRPVEGTVAIVPSSLAIGWHFARSRQLPRLLGSLIPASLILVLAAAAMMEYNRVITGSRLTTAYQLHESQYQMSPQFPFMPVREHLTYSSYWLRYYYETFEMGRFQSQNSVAARLNTVPSKLRDWWGFYWGWLLSIPLGVALLLDNRRLTDGRLLFLVAACVCAVIGVASARPSLTIAALLILVVTCLGALFTDLWSRLAVWTIVLVLLETLVTKWAFPHYSAPITSLVVFLQAHCLRRLWLAGGTAVSPDRSESSRPVRDMAKALSATVPRAMVVGIPILCMLGLCARVGARAMGEVVPGENGFDVLTLPLSGWNVRRAELQKMLTDTPGRQLVFVRYAPSHAVGHEWVYNHRDMVDAQVVWARDLGSQANRKLLEAFPNRTAWLVEADAAVPILTLHPDQGARPTAAAPPSTPLDSTLPW